MTGKTNVFGFAAQLIVLLFSLFLLTSFSWAGEDIEVNVESSNGVPLSNLNVYAFTESGSYTGVNATTDEDGTAIYNTDSLDAGTYKFRADYLGNQFWSQVITLPDTLSVDLIVEEETAEVSVTTSSGPSQGVKVYLFSGTGSYLGLYETTDEYGKVSFDLPVDRDFEFRADILGSQYWSDIVTIVSGGINDVSVDAGGGTLYVTVDKGAGIPMEGINTYLFNTAGSYLGLSQASNASGMVEYDVPQGDYKLRADYLGNQFWSQDTPVTEDTEITISIPHQEVVITVEGTYQTIPDPIEGINVYLFSSSGSYMGQYEVTDGSGQVTFNLPEQTYKVRADYMGQQFWSDDFTWQDTTVDIPMADAEITVTGAGLPLEDVNVYVFSESGSYLGLYGTTDVDGIVTFRLPAGTYNFRADYQGSQYWSDAETLTEDQSNPVDISTGGGVFTLTVFKGVDDALTGVNCYLFSESGSYLGLYDTTDTNGQVSFSLADGTFKIRVDYLGDQFWTDVYEIPTILSDAFIIPHQDVVITIQGTYQGTEDSMEGINVYLFSSSGSYMGQYEVTDGSGQVTFNLPEQSYKVRADYLGQQFWSGDFTWQDTTVDIPMADAEITVTGAGLPLEDVNVYVFSDSGSYLGIYETTDVEGIVTFRLPAGTYNFRADYQGSQYWSDAETLTADQSNPVDISTGGGIFTLTVFKGVDDALSGVNCYLFSESGSYLGLYDTTDTSGQVSFSLADGTFKIRVDYLGNQFWTDVYEIPTILSDDFTIPHQDVVITIQGAYQGAEDPLEGINVYLFSSSGSYMGQYEVTDGSGQVTFNLPEQTYKVRADYMGQQFWSGDFTWQDTTVTIQQGIAQIHVFRGDTDVAGASVYLFSEAGSYLGRYETTDTSGMVQFLVPSGPYKFRANEGGDQIWSDVVTITADQVNSVELNFISNTPPSITIIEPDGVDDIADSSFTIQWTDDDPDDDATISLYYDTDNTGADGTLIAGGLSEDPDGAEDEYIWDTSEIPDGDYYIYAVIDDGINDPLLDYSDGYLTIEHISSFPEYKVTADGSEDYDEFGTMVAIDNDFAIIGAPYYDVGGYGGYSNAGSAYVYKRDGSTWVEQHILISSDPADYDEFGESVAISGDYAIIGAPNKQGQSEAIGWDGSHFSEYYGIGLSGIWDEDHWTNAYSPGFVLSPTGTWADGFRPTAVRMYHDNPEPVIFSVRDYSGGTLFGISESYSSGDILPLNCTDDIGRLYANSGGTFNITGIEYYVDSTPLDDAGVVYIFKRDGSTWIQQVKLVPSDAAVDDQFGTSVDIDGGYAIVGACTKDNEEGGYGGYSNAGASYIFRRDGLSWTEEAKLIPDDSESNDLFGKSVAIDGEYAIVGAYCGGYGGYDGLWYAGEAYIFKQNGSIWTQESKLIPSQGAERDRFGNSVDIDGDYAIVGAPHDTFDDESAGSAFIFKRDGTTWTEEARLIAPDSELGDHFGQSVSIEGDYAFVGSPGKTDAGAGSGATYVYKREGSEWIDYAKITSPDLTEGDNFGYSISKNGDFIIIGAPGDDDNGTNAGSAYFYLFSNGTISAFPENIQDGESSILSWYYPEASSVFIDQGIGYVDNTASISVSPSATTTYTFTIEGPWGTTIRSVTVSVVSPPSITLVEPDGVDDSADSSFTIQWTDNDPDDDATIFLYYDSDNSGADGTLIAGGLSEDPDGAEDEYIWDTSEIPDGDYYIYAVIDDGINDPLLEYSDGVVSINHVLYDEFRITADDLESGAYFGNAVSISGDYVIVGAFSDDSTGSAYIFERDGLTWTQQAKIKASDAQSSAAFGRAVSICGDYAIVGARAHDSSTDSYAGAAYIFKRDGSDWIEQTKLTASDQQEHAYFGQSVSINGDYAIVGANGNEAAYIFKRDGSDWIEQAKIQAADPGENDNFGISVAISGDYAIVGDDYHDSYSGAAYIFRRYGSEWIQQAKLMAGDAEPDIFFGCSVSIDGGYAMVGANHQDFYGTSPGSAYIFRFNGSGWIEEAKLTASDGTAADHFGGSVSINGSYAIVGSNGAGYFGTSASGSYIFKREGSVWTEQAKIPGKDLDSSGYFQSFVDLDGVYAVVGSPYAYIDGNYNAGAAYIYTISHVNINSNQAIIQNGASATLTWSSVDATSVEIDNGIGEVASEGSIIVSPTETTTYTITATGTWGTEISTVTVYVINPPTVILSADESSVMIGDSVNLTWDSSDADTCVIEPDIGAVDPSGSIEIIIYEDITYTITATNIVGLVTDTVEITAVSALEDTNFGIGMDEQQGGGGLVGETVNVLNGNVVEYRSDVRFSSPNQLGLPLIATYNSKSDISGPMGHGWSHTYSPSLDPSFGINGLIFLKIIDDTGRAHYFIEETTGEYTGVFGEHSSVKAESGEYVWHLLDGSECGFSSAGLLAWIDDAIGNRLELAYDVNDGLQTVTDNASGRTITFHYNVDNLIEYVTGPVTDAVSDGTWVSYGYDTDQNLTSVTYADGSGFNYTYEDANDIHNLTGKTNKADHLINTWGYDTDDRAISNFSRDGRGVDIVYESDTQVNVTDAYGKLREYYISEIRGRKRIDTIIGSPGGAGAFPYSSDNIVSWIYDDEVRPIEVESAAGTINQYLDYDERGNPGTVILAYDTTEERIIYYTYHPDMDSPLTMTELSVLVSGDKETIWDYDDDYDSIPNESPTPLVSQIIEKGFTMDETEAVVSYEYITEFTYNSEGQVLSIDGPLPGTDDTTSFDYDPATGDLLSITRPIIGDTAFSGYDEAGQVGSVTDVNGQSKSYTYDGRGRITVITNNTDGSTIETPYNIAGLPVSSTDEDIITTGFEYDSVYGRLDIRTDSEDNYIDYDYDSQGNITEQGYYDAEDTLTNRKRFLYQHANHDMPGLLYREINPDDSYTQYGYDPEGNVTSVKDPNGDYTYYEYDPLNRLETVTQPGSIVTTYDYDLHGNLVSVIDAENNETTYQYDDMGRLVSTTSPDTGTVTYIYDEAGNPVSKTDEKDIIVSYLYDDLNRLTDVNFPDSTENITYSYDEGTNGIGRRTGMTDQSGNTSFVYDYRGLLKDRISTINDIEYTTSQSYTLAGRITYIVYPSGRSVDYSRTECVCGIDGVSTTYDGNTVTLMGDLTYRPFGVATNMTTGAGGTVNNQFNSSGRLEVANPGEQTERSYGYDANGKITSFQVTEEPWKDRTYVYDALNRLEAATGKYGTVNYTYDDVGNRLTKTSNGVTDSYTYYPDTNKLNEVVTETETITYTYDLNGNITGIGDKILTYNQNNRLVTVADGSGVLGEYTYNGLGQRVIKTAGGSTIVFHYDFDGNIIGESDDSGNFTKEYLYKGESRLAMVDVGTGEVYFYMNDHLGTPQAITNEAGESVWEALYQPFGEAYVHPMSSVENNFRFPGQYYDSETGLHYNYHRYYDPGVGRYLTPDQIGQDGGINLYTYVRNNPICWIDPLGLADTLRTRVLALMAKGNIKEALAIAQAGGLAIAPRINQLQKIIESITQRFPASSLRCDIVARTIHRAAERAGANPQIIKVVDKYYAQLFTDSRGVEFSRSGSHLAVRIGNRVFDALTGPKGMDYGAYVKMLEGFDIYVKIIPQ